MCDRYSFALSREKVIRRFSVKALYPIQAHYNISPGSSVPVITQAMPTQLSPATWHILPPKPATRPVHAITAEQAAAHPYWNNLLANSRCLLLADGFYLWKKISKKGRVPFRVALKWNLPFAIAGVYQREADASVRCAMLTVSANELLQPFHASMPAILPIEQEKNWLSPELPLETARQMLTPFPADRLKIFPVSAQLTNPQANSPAFTQPAQPTDQFGNFVLFSEE